MGRVWPLMAKIFVSGSKGLTLSVWLGVRSGAQQRVGGKVWGSPGGQGCYGREHRGGGGQAGH